VNRCIYCGSNFERAIGEPHSTKLAGCALTSDITACNTCQKNFGDTMTPAVGEDFSWLRNLFGIFTGRGKPALERGLFFLLAHRRAIRRGRRHMKTQNRTT
jgi:hypothetical protein